VLALWSSFAFESQRELEQVNRGMPAGAVSEMIGWWPTSAAVFLERSSMVSPGGRPVAGRADE